MSIFSRFIAAISLPTFPLPKPPKGAQAIPGYRRTAAPTTAVLRRNDRLTQNLDRLANAKSQVSTNATIRELSQTSPDLSSAVSFLLRTGIPEGFVITARTLDGKISPDATALAHELLRRLTYMGNVDGSFGSQMTIQSLSEQLGKELILYGSACLEVALDKARVPASMNPISVTTLRMFDEDNSFKLQQYVSGVEIDLDLPTIIYTTVDQLLTDAYSSSYMEAAIQPILTDIDFNNDMRRVLKRSVHPRLQAVIDSELIKKLAPPDILNDPDKFAAYKLALIQEVQSVVNESQPEDAFVSFDSVKYNYVEGGQDPSGIIERIQAVLNGKLVAGVKTLPVILGLGGSANSSSAEALLYVKQADMLRRKLNEMYSRALTIAVRLMGQDCYVDFLYDPINLKPTAELEAFAAMKQSRVLQLLSLGLITDEEASLQLTGNLPPEGYTPLAGTMFQSGSLNIPANPASNTSAMDKAAGTTTPTGVKSQNKGKRTP